MNNFDGYVTAGHDGRRSDRQTLAADRAAALEADIANAMLDDDHRREMATRHACGETVREIAEAVERDASTICRTIPTSLMAARVDVLTAVLDEGLAYWPAVVVSMRTMRMKPCHRDHSWIVCDPTVQTLFRKRPTKEKLRRSIRQQKSLLDLAADHDADLREPFVASRAMNNHWIIDFPIICVDHKEARLAATDVGASMICRVATGEIAIV